MLSVEVNEALRESQALSFVVFLRPTQSVLDRRDMRELYDVTEERCWPNWSMVCLVGQVVRLKYQ